MVQKTPVRSIWIKRDDCTGLAFGGNKVRQLEFYLGGAQARGADTVLVTGAVQSNLARLTASGARRLGMEAHVQLEERVEGNGELYRTSGNLLLNRVLGATLHTFPGSEDEAAAGEVMDQARARGIGFDAVICASGSALTHARTLVGMRALGERVPVYGRLNDAVLRFRLLVTDPGGRFDSDTVTITVEQGTSPPITEDRIYYFPHLAVGVGWQTTITYINYSSEEVSCQTEFLSDQGTPLLVSFADQGTVDSRPDTLPPGGSVHQETNVELNAPLAPGWARATCSGPVKASLLFRQHNSEGVPVAEAGVNAATVPATRFVTFAEQEEGKHGTGVAYANPSDTEALVTFTARDADGRMLASVDKTLLPNGHDAQNMALLFGLSSFTGSLEIISTEPIVSLSLNFEADPVFSSLPPGEDE